MAYVFVCKTSMEFLRILGLISTELDKKKK